MRVLVNAVAARRGGGASNLVPYMRELAQHMSDSTFAVYITKDFSDRVPLDQIEWREVDVPAGIQPRRLLWDNVTIPKLSRDFDAVLSPLNFGPVFTRRPHVLLQRNILYFDRETCRAMPAKRRMAMAGYRWLAAIGMNTADVVVVPSQAMADAVSPYILRRAKVRVALHGFDRHVMRRDGSHLPETANAWRTASIRLLHVGSPAAHKNLQSLVRTLATVKALSPAETVRLAVTFDESASDVAAVAFCTLAGELGVRDDISFLGTLPHDAALALYDPASVLLFPSTCESFGFPVLESLAAGTLVVASDLPALREVGGRFARYHDRNDSARAADLVIEALANAPDASERRAMDLWVDGFSLDREVAVVARALSAAVTI